MVSIIICTYNRSAILHLCLQRLADYAMPYAEKLEILVIDNNSTDGTKKMVEQFGKNHPALPLKYVFEKEQGLSVARNTGANKAKYEWLFYLDDDALILETTLQELYFTIENFDFDIFGGVYTPYYLTPKPNWISEKYGTKKTEAKEINELGKDKIEGCIMVMHKRVFEALNGFNINLGMLGNKYGYNEESEFIRRAQLHNYKLGINPFFKIEHIVRKDKHKLINHFKAYFALARDKTIGGEKLKINAIRTITLLPFRIIKYFLKFILQKEFYFQNFLWFSFNNSTYLLGYLCGIIIKKK